MRSLSGMQPSGRLHLGNYFGAAKQWAMLQDAGHECFYFIANYHAMTTMSREELETSTLDLAMSYIALGIDPQKSVFYVQSDVPQVTELCWMLNCVCPVSMMEKGTSYKDKQAKGISASMGLFDYPVLQAADITIVDANVVPVGQDQRQHVEMTRDLAVKFNSQYGQTLVVPEAMIVPEVAVVPGIDGEKMSKSYGNAIEIFQTPKATRKRCMQIVTDSKTLEEPKDPDHDNVYALLKLVAEPAELAEIAAKYRAGGYGYGHAKDRLAELINARFEPARERYAELERSPDTVRDILAEGGRRARAVAEATMERVRAACGILTHR